MVDKEQIFTEGYLHGSRKGSRLQRMKVDLTRSEVNLITHMTELYKDEAVPHIKKDCELIIGKMMALMQEFDSQSL